MSPARDILLELDRIAVTRGDARVLDGITLDVRAGEVLGLVFTHGMGKTTLLHVAGGLLEPDAGEVRWRGRPLAALSGAELATFREKTAIVFQGGGLFVNTTCFNNVALPLRYHTRLSEPEIEDRVRAALATVGMEDARDRFPWELSAAKQRLVGLARALIRDPELVLFDDFTQGAEAVAWRRLTRVVLEARTRRGTAFVLVLEADPSVYALADRLCVIEDGRVLETSAPHAMRASHDQRVSGIFRTDHLGLEEGGS